MSERFFALKRFGQNFLVDKNILASIIANSDANSEDVVLEIGPGQGILTRALLDCDISYLHAVELDERLRPVLEGLELEEEKRKRLCLHWGDALKMKYDSLNPFPNKVIANIPYNITTPLIWRLLEFAPLGMTYHLYMVQREAAERLTAPADSKARYPLGITIEAMGHVEIIQNVSRSCFRPVPKVDSALIRILINKNLNLAGNLLWSELLHRAFTHRRKTLINNLSGFKNISGRNDRNDWQKILLDSGVDPNTRAEDVGCEAWLEVYKVVKQRLQK